MIKTLLVEDEPYTRKGLIAQIEKINTSIQIIGECSSVNEAVIVAKSCNPDLVFLDINLIDGTGFDFLNQTSMLDFKVIFITAYEDYALQAIKNGAIDYILKPVDIDELAIAVDKVLALSKIDIREQIKVTQEHFKGEINRIVLSLLEGYQIISFQDLIYCSSDKGYTTFHLVDGRSFIASKAIKDFELQLPSEFFIRTHQSYIVNINFVDKLDKNRMIYLKNGKMIPLAIRKKEEFISKLYR